MCDTFVALGNATADGTVILGKNSDREPNEAHEIRIYPACEYPDGGQVQCTYISIPQVRHTNAVLLAKPFWIWGAEMGINEHGVAIGNEAIFTRVPYETGPGLTGMDYLRLALERAESAWEALYTITDLLEKHGQGGSCGFTHPFYYHNSFLIADSKEAWVLETAGRQWAAEKVKSVRSISNAATIGSTWDLASDDLVKYAMDRGWCRGRGDFHFARCYSDIPYTILSDARSRQNRTTRLLEENRPYVSLRDAMQILRSHSFRHSHSADLHLDRPLLGATVCMHAGAGRVRGSQSVGSMVAHLANGLPGAWLTGTSAPCTGIFKPVWMDAGLPLEEPPLTGRFDPACLWWRHERLHRAVLRDYSNRIGLYAVDRDQMEEEFLRRAAACGASPQARLALSADCFQAADQASADWLERVECHPLKNSSRFYYQKAWKHWDHEAEIAHETVQN
jgi:dipeptidase